MNVFLLDRDHERRARYHCDSHANKMTLEAVQILNTALHIADDETGYDLQSYQFYKPTHINHPWTRWAADRGSNWRWLVDHADALGTEFSDRNDKTHASWRKMYELWIDSDVVDDIASMLPDGNRTRFPQCLGENADRYRDDEDPVDAYRNYYANEKYPQDWCSWSNSVPHWLHEYV